MTVPRIGVFICRCGTNIGGVVDVPQVVEYAKGLSDVVYAEENLYTCSEEGISSIKKRISEYDLNRVVVAACTPRTHEPLFRSACEEAGLNKYLFEFVNIREQCSWVHMNLPEKATEKAKSLVRAGVDKARILEPLEEIEIEVTPSSLVIGGGIAGMSAALTLANQGFDVHLVEKENALGGLLLNVNKIFPTNEDAESLLKPIVKAVESHPKVRRHMSATVKAISGYIGNFDVSVNEEGGETEFKVGTIIVATGAEVLEPDQYGYGKFPNVLTQLDLEQQLKNGQVKVHSVVTINCVGARVPERPYCSRFCCMTAIKNAMLIKESNPTAKVYILHRDVMSYGVELEEYYQKARDAGVRFLRYSLDALPQVVGNERVVALKVHDEVGGEEIELPADLLVLTTPLISARGNEMLSKMLKASLGNEGFFLEAHLKLRPVEFAMDGIYVCGCSRWPANIPESICQGYAAASKAAIPMRTGYVKPEAITASVNEDICTGCKTCFGLCPSSAIEMRTENGKEIASVITALCRGCGTCGAACPSGAISMNHFQDKQILGQIEALVT